MSSAREAFQAWKEVPIQRRSRVMFKLQELIRCAHEHWNLRLVDWLVGFKSYMNPFALTNHMSYLRWSSRDVRGR